MDAASLAEAVAEAATFEPPKTHRLLSIALFERVTDPNPKEQSERAWPAIVKRLSKPKQYAAKAACPLFTLVRFGDLKNAEGNLRHDANVTAVDGAIGDYDGGEVTPQEAANRLRARGIEALIYTSPRHRTTDLKSGEYFGERWRAVCPLSKTYPADDHGRMISLLNGALGGILAVDSWTPISRSYYFGRVRGVEWEVHCIEGQPLDLVRGIPEIPAKPVSKAAEPPQPADPVPIEPTPWRKLNNLAMEHLSAWVPKLFPAARPYQDGGYRIASADLGRDLEEDISIVPGGAKDFGVHDLGDPRGGARTPIDLVIEHSGGQYATPHAAARWLCRHLNRSPAEFGVASEDSAADAFGAFTIEPIGSAVLEAPPTKPAILVDGLIPQDACGIVAPGGSGKSTIKLLEAVNVILGRPVWGHAVLKPGKVLYVSAEDTAREIKSRLNQVCRALELTGADTREVGQNFLLVDLSTVVNARLVAADPKSGDVRETKMVQHMIDRYRDLGIAQIVFDPASMIGPGEHHMNDGATALMKACRRIALTIQTAVEVVAHVGQTVARAGIMDQYAGRGATAFADNSRGNRQIVQVRKREFIYEDLKYTMPEDLREEDFRLRRVLAILPHKLSYAELDPTPIFVRRRGFRFDQFHADAETAPAKSAQSVRSVAEDTEVLLGFIQREAAAGRLHTVTTLEDESKALAISQKRIRRIVEEATQTGLLVEEPRPATGKKGPRGHYLRTVDGHAE